MQLTGRPARYDYEYKRHGTANLFCAVEPKAGWHLVRATPNRTGPEFAKVIRAITPPITPPPTRSTS